MPYLPPNNSFWSWIRRIRKAEEGEGRHVDRHGGTASAYRFMTFCRFSEKMGR